MSSPVIQILAPTTPPPASPRRQRHAPRSAGHYREYRACLRWDAGFTCCFCLVHESAPPWCDAWGEHFRLCDDRLEPVHQGLAGQHARYTAQVYRMNDARKIERRRERRALVQDRVRLFAHDPAELRHAARTHPLPAQRSLIIEMVRELEILRRRAIQELRLRSPVPRDAPGACRCDGQEHCCLPPAVSVMELRV